MLDVGVEIWGINHNIIQINEERLADQPSQTPLHQALEGCRRIAEAKGHPLELIEAQWSDECSLFSILWIHLHLP